MGIYSGKWQRFVLAPMMILPNHYATLGLFRGQIRFSTPLQSIAEAHITGCRAAQQSGDILSLNINHVYCLVANYVSGQCLRDIRKDARNRFMEEMHQRTATIVNNCLLHLQAGVLAEGLHLLESKHIDNVPGLEETLSVGKQAEKIGVLVGHVHWIVRTYLFHQVDNEGNVTLISDLLSQKKILFRPIFFMGELTSFAVLATHIALIDV